MAGKGVSLTAQAYRQIKDKIQQLVYAPGAVLIETKLADELQMSRNPVRLATRLLESEGLLVKDHYKRLTVKNITKKDVIEIYQLRELLERSAFKLIFNSGKANEYSYKLEEKVVRMRGVQSDIFRWENVDTDLHLEIVSIFDNDRISRIYLTNQFEQIRICVLSKKTEEFAIYINKRLLEMLEYMRANNFDKAFDILYHDHITMGRELALAQLPD